jgi:hypothetical protein
MKQCYLLPPTSSKKSMLILDYGCVTCPTQPLGEINGLAKAQEEEASGAPDLMP